MPLVDDAFRIGCNRVIYEDVDVILGAEQCTNVTVQNKVRLLTTLNRFSYFWVGSMHKISYFAANILLPIRKRMYILVNTRIGVYGAHRIMVPPMQLSMPTP